MNKREIKKPLFLLMGLLLILGVLVTSLLISNAHLSQPALADNIYELKYQYLSDTDSYRITNVTGTPIDVIIPERYDDNGEYGEKSVTSIGLGAFANKTTMESVFIPNSINEILSVAFTTNANLTSIIFEEGIQLKNINSSCFNHCTNLTSIIIPKSVETIGISAFSNCNSLNTVVFEENNQLNLIGENAFSNCISLPSITIPNSVQEIEKSAFYNCSSLSSVDFEANSQLETIGESAFSICLNLFTITIPESVTFIADDAFLFCYRLVQFINLSSFPIFPCPENKGLEIKDSIETPFENTLSDYDNNGILTFTITNSKEFNGVYILDYMGNLVDLDLSDYDADSIYSAAFYMQEFMSVTLPNITSIDDWAFMNCMDLISITIPDSVISIGQGAFFNCLNLETMVLKNATPPEINNSISTATTTIYVPRNSVNTYKTDTNWAEHADHIYPETVIVTFKDHDGTIIQVNGSDTQEVDYGSSANAPDDPYRSGHNFSGWDVDFSYVTEDLIVTATYTEVLYYTYTFYDEDGITVIETRTVEYGSQIVPPKIAGKPPTQQYTYIFNGWDKEIPEHITEDIIFIAQYSEILNQYTVTFEDHDGTIIQVNGSDTQEVDYGSSANAPDDPYRSGHNFSGWDVDFSYVTEDLIVTATYTPAGEISPHEYSVTFKDYDGTIIQVNGNDTQYVNYGSSANAPDDPYRSGHNFSGWDVDFSYVTEDLIVTATYTPDALKVLEHTYTFYDEDGTTILKTETVESCSVITEPPTPEKPATQQYTYTFSGWDKEVPEHITEDITFTAQYAETLRQYTVTFKDYNDDILFTQDISYGSILQKPSNPILKENMLIEGWFIDKKYTEKFEFGHQITKEITIYAKINIIVGLDTGEPESQDLSLSISTLFTELENIKEENKNKKLGYTLNGWEYNGQEITEETEYNYDEKIELKAIFIPNIYSISFSLNYTDAEESIDSLDLAYGGIVDILPIPERKNYTFLGWYYEDTKIEEGQAYSIAKDITVMAIWEVDSFSLLPAYMVGGAILLIVGLFTAIFFLYQKRIKDLPPIDSNDDSNEQKDEDSSNNVSELNDEENDQVNEQKDDGSTEQKSADLNQENEDDLNKQEDNEISELNEDNTSEQSDNENELNNNENEQDNINSD